MNLWAIYRHLIQQKKIKTKMGEQKWCGVERKKRCTKKNEKGMTEHYLYVLDKSLRDVQINPNFSLVPV